MHGANPIAATRTVHALALVSDAYGGFGGISRFNRDFLGALAGLGPVKSLTVLPRLIPGAIEEALPPTILHDCAAAKGKGAFLMRTFRQLGNPFDLVICGHINLLPVAYVLARAARAHLVLVIHGIEAWRRPRNPLAALLARRIDTLIAVSDCSAKRFLGWSKAQPRRQIVLPNCVDLQRFRPGPKNPGLIARYGLNGCKVLMTLGRLAGEDRRKGFDEVLEALPAILRRHGDVKYLIAGEGEDRPRLEEKARALGLADRVVFAGRIAEDEKVDHYNLADVYVMPSSGEGFGIVLIEAAACGVPVIGSKTDGAREALLDGRLGALVDPARPDELVRAVCDLLDRPLPRARNPLIETFGADRFRARVADWLNAELAP